MEDKQKGLFTMFNTNPIQEKPDQVLQSTMSKEKNSESKAKDQSSEEQCRKHWLSDIEYWKNDFKNKVKQMNDEINCCKESVKRSNHQIAGLSAGNESSKNELANRTSVIIETSKKIAEYEASLTKIKGEVGLVNDTFDSVSCILDKQKEIKIIEDRKYDNSSQIANALKSEFNEKITQIHELRTAIQSKKQLLDEWVQQKSEFLKGLSSEYDEKKKLQVEMQNSCAKIKHSISATESETLELQNKLKTICANVQKVVSTISEITDKTRMAANIALDKIDSRIKDCDKRIKLTKMKVHNIQKGRIVTRQETERIQEKCKELDSSIANKERFYEKCKQTAESMQVQVDNYKMKNMELSLKLESLKSGNEELRVKLSEFNVTVEACKSEYELKIGEKEKPIADLSEKLKEAKRKRDLLKATIEKEEKDRELKSLKKVETSVVSTRKKLSKMDSAELFSVNSNSDTEDEAAKPSKIASSRKTYSKPKTSTKRDTSEKWF